MKDPYSFQDRGPKYENTGHRMEADFIGAVNKKQYDLLAFEHIQEKKKKLLKKGDNNAKAYDKDAEYERILRNRDAATARFDDFLKFQRAENFINYEDSLALVEKSQYGNPEKPAKFFSSALYKYVLNRFDDEKYSLKFYTATGLTHLDILHGVDCFFKLCDKESGEEIIKTTVDLTGNRDKGRAKADIVIMINQEERDQMDPSKVNENFNQEVFQAKIDEYGELIALSLRDNYHKKINKKKLENETR